MKKTLFIRLIGLTLFLGGFFSLMIVQRPTLAAEPEVVWKVQTFFQPGLPWYKSIEMWAEDVSRMSGGRMKIDLFGPAIGETRVFVDILGAVQRGTRDAGHTTPFIMAGKYPAASLFSGIPAFLDLLGYFTWMQAYGGKELLQETFGDAVKIFPVGMIWAKTGAWANKKIESLSDFRGLKYANAPEFWAKILSEAGAKVEGSGWEALLHFQEGTLDIAEYQTPYYDMVLGFHKFTKYCYFPGISVAAMSLALLVNNQKWEALPPDLKEIVKAACDTAMVRSLTQWIVLDVKAVQVLKDGGKVTVLKYPRELQQEILDKLVPQYDAVPDPMFQKVWKSQKEFMKVYVPYMKLQQVDAEVKMK